MEDQDIVALYWARSEQAIAETAKKYGRYCGYIANCILSNEADAEEVVSDTYLKAWNTIPPKRPESLKAYVGMLCRQLALDVYEARHAQKRNGGEVPLMLDELAECIPDAESDADIGECVALREALNRFLAALPEKARVIFLRRYWYAMPISQIAADFSMNENHVAVLLYRTRQKLKKHLNQEGFDV